MKKFVFWAMMLPAILHADTNSVKLTCWILCQDNGSSAFSAGTVSNLVQGVNEIFSQVDLSFYIGSVSLTNDSGLANLVYANSSQKNAICSITNGTDGIELYFVNSLLGRPTAFSRADGIVIGPLANAQTVAHEIGHACGLSDIYNRSSETSLKVTVKPQKDRMPDDWGWYPPTIMQTNIIQRLLMFGYRNSDKADLSFGDIFGLYYTSERNVSTGQFTNVWHLGNAPVGFDRHGNCHPVSQ